MSHKWDDDRVGSSPDDYSFLGGFICYFVALVARGFNAVDALWREASKRTRDGLSRGRAVATVDSAKTAQSTVMVLQQASIKRQSEKTKLKLYLSFPGVMRSKSLSSETIVFVACWVVAAIIYSLKMRQML